MSSNFDIIPTSGDIGGKTYDRFINDYWNFLMKPASILDSHVHENTIFTRGCYDYRDVHSLLDIQRRSFCGDTEESPSIIHAVGTRSSPFNPGVNYPVFVTVLDTIALYSYIDENGNSLSLSQVLDEENNAVTPRDVQLTISQVSGGGAPTSVPVFTHHRFSASVNLEVPSDSVLADRMERPIRPGSYPNAKAEGFYVLIKFNIAGAYRIRSCGFGVRKFKYLADYYIQIP
jgi:hypothetical protein